MSRILITGSNGLIGKKLAKALSSQGFDVQGFDNAHATNQQGYGDILHHQALLEAAKGCCGIVHLAAVSRVVWGEQDPPLCHAVNVRGTENILDVARKSSCSPWVLYASSREVYGQQQALPVKEDVPLSPMNVYAKSKVEAEMKVQSYRSEGMHTAIVRYSNVYGCKTDHSDRVIPAFCRAAASGESIRIDGFHNVFDFNHVSDTVLGTMAMIQLLMEGRKDLPPIHLTTGQGTSLIEAAQLAIKNSAEKIPIEEAPSRTFDVAKFYGDPTLARDILGWEAQIPLEDGMKQLIEDYRKDLVTA